MWIVAFFFFLVVYCYVCKEYGVHSVGRCHFRKGSRVGIQSLHFHN